MDSKKKGIKHRKYVSVGITLSIVLMLILSGPVGAVNLKVDIPDDSVKKGESVTFDVSATISDPDSYVPIDNFTVKIGDTNKEFTFSTDGDVISVGGINLEDVNVTLLSVPSSEDYGSGDGYAHDSNDGEDYTLGPTQGYGYGNGKGGVGKDLEFIYKITLDTSSFSKGTYEVAFILNTGNSAKPTFESGKTSFKVTTTTGGGGSSSGGGGGGGSPEPASNVQVKELAQQFVTNGNRIRFEFTRKATTVDYVEFDAKRSFGKTTTIIEELKGISVLTPADPEGEIYKHINIWVGNGGFSNTQNIGNPAVGFRVNKTWIAENEIIESTITLHRYSEDSWNSLGTRKIGEDEGFIYFEASSPGFSPFAIAAKNNKLVIEEKEEEAPTPTGTEQPAETETPETEESPGEKEKTGISKSIMLKAFSFIIGFMLVILIGLAVMEKRKR